jgi:hypothetical protein
MARNASARGTRRINAGPIAAPVRRTTRPRQRTPNVAITPAVLAPAMGRSFAARPTGAPESSHRPTRCAPRQTASSAAPTMTVAAKSMGAATRFAGVARTESPTAARRKRIAPVTIARISAARTISSAVELAQAGISAAIRTSQTAAAPTATARAERPASSTFAYRLANAHRAPHQPMTGVSVVRADSPALTGSPASAAAPAPMRHRGARHACHALPAITPMTARTTPATPVRRAGMRRKPGRANAPNVHWERSPTRVHRAHANPVPPARSPSTFARPNASPAPARGPAMRPAANAWSRSAIRGMRRTDPGSAPPAAWEATRPMEPSAFPAAWAPIRTWWDRARARRARPVALPR